MYSVAAWNPCDDVDILLLLLLFFHPKQVHVTAVLREVGTANSPASAAPITVTLESVNQEVTAVFREADIASSPSSAAPITVTLESVSKL